MRLRVFGWLVDAGMKLIGVLLAGVRIAGLLLVVGCRLAGRRVSVLLVVCGCCCDALLCVSAPWYLRVEPL